MVDCIFYDDLILVISRDPINGLIYVEEVSRKEFEELAKKHNSDLQSFCEHFVYYENKSKLKTYRIIATL
jgi:hypothetical protein